MTRHAQSYRVLNSVANEIDAYMKRPCSPAPEHGLTPVQQIAADPILKAVAAAEWDAMDARGQLPADWPERRAEIVRRFGGAP